VRIERNDRPTAAADIVRFDNLSLGPLETMLPRLNLTRNAAQAVLTGRRSPRCSARNDDKPHTGELVVGHRRSDCERIVSAHDTVSPVE
jgi:hypothetical protein